MLCQHSRQKHDLLAIYPSPEQRLCRKFVAETQSLGSEAIVSFQESGVTMQNLKWRNCPQVSNYGYFNHQFHSLFAANLILQTNFIFCLSELVLESAVAERDKTMEQIAGLLLSTSLEIIVRSLDIIVSTISIN